MNDHTAAEPIRSTVAGVDLVTIPVSHYAELLDCQRRLAVAGHSLPLVRGGPKKPN